MVGHRPQKAVRELSWIILLFFAGLLLLPVLLLTDTFGRFHTIWLQLRYLLEQESLRNFNRKPMSGYFTTMFALQVGNSCIILCLPVLPLLILLVTPPRVGV